MPQTLGRKLLVLVLLVLAVASWQWLDDRSGGAPTIEPTVSELRNETDYFMENFTIESVTSENGDRLRISGDSLAHYLDSGQSRVVNPRVYIEGVEQQYWHGEASTGSLSPEYTVLVLDGGVTFRHHKSAEQTPTVMTTETVRLNTTLQTLQSRKPVQLSAPGWTFNATGLQARIRDGHLLFPASVEAVYAPRH